MFKRSVCMVRVLFLLLGVVASLSTLSAQEIDKSLKREGQVGVSLSYGESEIYSGGTSYGYYGLGSSMANAKNYFSVGLIYLKPMNSWLDLEFGVDYSNYSIEEEYYYDETLYAASYIGTDIGHYVSNRDNLSLITVPAYARVNFWNYLFVTSGLFVDIQIDESSFVDDQHGIGAMFGLGAKCNLNSGLSLFLNPYFKWHSLLSFNLSGDSKDTVQEAGLRFGVTYSL